MASLCAWPPSHAGVGVCKRGVCGWDYTCVCVCVCVVYLLAPSPIVLCRSGWYSVGWSVCVGGGGAGIRIVLGMDGRLWLCLWGAVGIPLGGISSSDSPSLPLCYLLVCVGILMVDRRRANKLRRSMSSPPYFPAHRPALLHAYTVSRAGSFVQARVPWTRSAPLSIHLLSRCSLPLPSTLSLLETNAHVHTPQPHGPRLSIKHAPHHYTHPPIPAVTAAHGLCRMGCAVTQLTVVATRIVFVCGMRS